MRAQLQHLIEVSTRPNTPLTLQVLPLSVGAHPGMNGPFVVLEFHSPTDPPMVYLETATDGLYLEEPPDIERYTLRFNHLVARALGPGESRTMIADIAPGRCGMAAHHPDLAPRSVAQEHPELLNGPELRRGRHQPPRPHRHTRLQEPSRTEPDRHARRMGSLHPEGEGQGSLLTESFGR
jgi:hypothetical protein